MARSTTKDVLVRVQRRPSKRRVTPVPFPVAPNAQTDRVPVATTEVMTASLTVLAVTKRRPFQRKRREGPFTPSGLVSRGSLPHGS